MSTRKLIYEIGDKPRIKSLLLYSFQMLLAILAATIAVPSFVGQSAQIPSAILGAGIGTIVYILFTRGKSPVMLSSSFAFLSSLTTALTFGYMGVALGGLFAGLVYVIIAIIVHFVGTKWLNKLMPPVIIGPVVALIGLSLAVNAIRDLQTIDATTTVFGVQQVISVICGLITFFIIVICTIQNKRKGIKLIPFIIGIAAGYIVATIFTIIGKNINNNNLIIINFKPLQDLFAKVSWKSFITIPEVSIYKAIKELADGTSKITGVGVATVALAFIPVAFVTFAEHIADHKNLGTIIDKDLLNKEPGLSRTLLGDGVGSIAGTFFGFCPNTTYGESIACVAMTKNASIYTTIVTAGMCVILSFLAPFNTALATIPRCVMGGVCLALYGYIAVSGLKMFKEVDLDDNTNLLTVCSILIAGIGGLALRIPYEISGDGIFAKYIEIGNIATALLLGIATYNIGNKVSGKKKTKTSEINTELKNEDLVRSYLKQFDIDRLVQGLAIFGFVHENIDYTVASLSNFMRSEEMLRNRTREDLVTLINLFELHGYKKGMKKPNLIKLIKEDCNNIDKLMIKSVSGQEIK